MSSDDEVPGEETFADVLNGLSLTGRRPRGRHPSSEPAPAEPAGGYSPLTEDLPEENAAVVRAYAWTGGRTRSNVRLELETLVSTSDRAVALMDTLRAEHQSVARLCRRSISVAEVGALLSLPIGVVRVLLCDMATLDLIDIHRNPTGEGNQPDLDLLERVLHGLTNLRATPARPRS